MSSRTGKGLVSLMIIVSLLPTNGFILAAPPNAHVTASRLGLASRQSEEDQMNRRRALESLCLCHTGVVGSIFCGMPEISRARNLPESTGADESKSGSPEALIPLVTLNSSLLKAKEMLKDSPLDDLRSALLRDIPSVEKDFKRLFDDYSARVSYKQRFLDQNAFLVYYTQGYDGPNRPSIETSTPEEELQTRQFGARNDAWIAWEELQAELGYQVRLDRGEQTRDDLNQLIAKLSESVERYLAFAPKQDVLDAQDALRGR